MTFLSSSKSLTKQIDYKELLIDVLIFCSALNLFNRFYFFAFGAALAYAFFNKINIPATISIFALFLYSLSYLIFDYNAVINLFSFLKPFLYPITFILGYNLLLQKKCDVKRLEDIFSIITYGTFLHLVLDFVINYNSQSRVVLDFWTRSERSATGEAILGVTIIAYFLYTVFSSGYFIKKIISTVMVVVLMMYNLVLAGRMIYGLFAIGLVVVLLYKFLLTKSIRHSIYSILLLVLIALLMYFLYSNNVFSIKTVIEDSNFFKRFIYNSRINIANVIEDSRNSLKMEYIKQMIFYPLGGNNIHESVGEYAHDLLLDSYDDCGIIGLLGLTTFLASSIVNVIQLFRVCRHKRLRLFSIVFHIIFFMIFYVEPIIAGAPWLFMIYCLLEGMLFACLKSYSSSGIDDTMCKTNKGV